ncbi:hypothetical protein PENTCL1PPCAC_21242 [Pristionchus entomophagus]|uniref:Collagen type IV alpha-3-binding protein n=1 Tax=Pristionchus entomophagus TaxID=358040 RepID=A0AAV5TY01_9BILA|nr:hypothetical protein PENTCL1PPCAC_21242 [Pristionchus entomophagus]
MTPATGATSEAGEGKRSIGGVLYKWTNYVSGWQPRYFEISNHTLVYYKSKAEKSAGCRGSIALKSAMIELTDDFGKCEFSLRVNADIVWYLKADSAMMRERWHRRLTADSDSDYSSKGHSRTPSAASSNYSNQLQHSPSGDGKREALISERLLELGSYRELCASQMAEIERELQELSSSSEAPIARVKLLTIKATHIAMLSNVDRILQLTAEQTEMVQVHQKPPVALTAVKREDGKAPSTPTSSFSTAPATVPSPAHSNGVTSDDEDMWHDADEESEEKMIDGESFSANDLSLASNSSLAQRSEEEKENQPAIVDRHLPFGCFDLVEFSSDHSLADEVHKLTESQLDYALKGAHDPTMWTLFASDGEMKMYKREIEQDGLPVDPLKALHSVKGVSALEFMHYFFDARYKMGWDHTLEDARIVEKIAEDLVVMHQKHKTVWPAAPRESLFWSHLRRVDDRRSEGAHDCYVVCNKDIKRADVPLGSSSAVRVGLTVSMICETFVDNPNNLPLSQLPRSAFTCKVIYVSSVHPGGWVPTSALRHVYKREYPKFLRTFTAFVHEKVKNSQQVAI